MRQRLERAGQRSISALVDVTNYVMLELGRPLHVYDLDKLNGAIDVRFGRRGEKVLLLNEQEVEVDASVLCITDDSGVIGLAGIMGGDSTKAESETKNIYLESAFFAPEAIAGRARRWGFASDASHRFERGVDFDNNVDGIERATQLILEICGGEPGPTDDLVARLPQRKPVSMRVARAQKVIGIPISGEEMADVFTRLGLAFEWQRRGLRRRASELPLRPRDRGGPDRGGCAGARLRAHSGAPAARGGEDERAAGGDAPAACGARAPRRARLPGSDQLQLRRAAMGSRLRRRGEPDPAAQPDREPVVGDAHQPDRLAGRQRALQPRPQAAAHPRVRSRPRVPARCRDRRRAAVGGRRAPADAHRRGGLRPGGSTSSGAKPREGSTSSISRPTSKRCWRRASRASRPRRTRRSTRGARRGSCSRAASRAGWASCIRAGSGATSCRSRWCCSSSTPRLRSGSTMPQPRVPSRFPPVVRDVAMLVDAGAAGAGADGRDRGREAGDRARSPDF